MVCRIKKKEKVQRPTTLMLRCQVDGRAHGQGAERRGTSAAIGVAALAGLYLKLWNCHAGFLGSDGDGEHDAK